MGGDGQTGAAQIGGRVMNEFEVVTVIGRPVGEVFRAFTDPGRSSFCIVVGRPSTD